MRDLKEAETWLTSARHIHESVWMGPERFTVVVAQCIHALIRANDALTARLLGRRSTRHEDAGALFGELIRQNKIPPKYANHRRLLIKASSEKSKYDYKGTPVGANTASDWIRKTERFIEDAKVILGL